MRNKHSGQALVEALFVVIFTTVIMFSFFQMCVMVIDDMSANEAAYSAMRSAVVTKKSARGKESKERVIKYLKAFYYPAGFSLGGMINAVSDIGLNIAVSRGNFKFADRDTVKEIYSDLRGENSNTSQNDDSEDGDNAQDNSTDSESVRLWTVPLTERGSLVKDFSRQNIEKSTVKIYYFTRVMFGQLTAPGVSKKTLTDKLFGIGGSRRYQSARSRMVASPDSAFYYKAYPGAKRFCDEDES